MFVYGDEVLGYFLVWFDRRESQKAMNPEAVANRHSPSFPYGAQTGCHQTSPLLYVYHQANKGISSGDDHRERCLQILPNTKQAPSIALCGRLGMY